MRDASRQARSLCPEDWVGCNFTIQGQRGEENHLFLFLGVVASPRYPSRKRVVNPIRSNQDCSHAYSNQQKGSP